MKRVKSSVCFWMVAIAFCDLARHGHADGIAWQTSWSTAQGTAQGTDKPIVVDFFTDWCRWCKKLDHETYDDQNVVDFSAKFIPLKLNAEASGRPVARTYNVHSFPNIVFMYPDGKVIHRFAGYINGPGFLAHMKYAYAVFAASRAPAPAPATSVDARIDHPQQAGASGQPAIVARAAALLAPPPPPSAWRSLESTPEARATQVHLDAAAARQPLAVVLGDAAANNDDPDAVIVVGAESPPAMSARPRPAAGSARSAAKAKVPRPAVGKKITSGHKAAKIR